MFVILPCSIALVLTLLSSGRPAVKPVLVAAFSALIPMSTYVSLFLKARHPSRAVWSRIEPTWASLIAHVTAAQYRGFLGRVAPDQNQRFFILYVLPYLLAALTLGLLLTFLTTDRVQRRILWTLQAVMVAQTLFCCLYGVPDRSTYLLPTIGLGLCALTPLAARLLLAESSGRRLLRWVVPGVAVVALAQWGPYLELAVGRSNLLVALDANIRRLWRAIPVERGIVLWEGDRLTEFQLFLGEKPGLLLLRPSDLSVPMSRERFAQRFGFSPGFPPGSVYLPAMPGPAFVALERSLASRLSLATHQPVILLSPSSGELTVVQEPAVARSLQVAGD